MRKFKMAIVSALLALGLAVGASVAPAAAVGTVTYGNVGPGTSWAAHFNHASGTDFTSYVAYTWAAGDFYRMSIWCYNPYQTFQFQMVVMPWELQRQPNAGVSWAVCPAGMRQLVGSGWPIMQLA